MTGSFFSGNCQCTEKDKQIQQFKSQIDQLQSKKLQLQATNLHLQEQLDDCTRELETRLVFKEDEVQALRGTYRAMSSQVLNCQERALALQEELGKKDEVLRVASSVNTSHWSVDKMPKSSSPRSTHSISIQTSLLKEEAESTASDDNSSPRSEAAPCFAEVQELRYTVQVLKEQLEELHSSPASPSDAASPKRIPCASLACMLEFNAKLRLVPSNSKTSKFSFSNQSNCSVVENCQDPSTLECQVFHTLLISELCAAEDISRQAISLERDGALREMSMTHNSFLTRHRLLLGGLQQLQRLEACQRGHLVETEMSIRNIFHERKDESARQVSVASQSFRTLADDVAVRAALEPRTLACEATGRMAIILEEECIRQALAMFGDWHRAQSHRTHQLAILESAERSCVVQDEEASWNHLWDNLETHQTPHLISSLASSVGEDFNSSLLMEELQDPWALHDHLRPQTPVSSSGGWSHTSMQTLASRQERAFKLLVQQECSDWSHLIWLSDVELSQCVFKCLLQTQLSCGHLAESIGAEEQEARNALKQLFEAELLDCLRTIAKRRCFQKVCTLWENERWTPMTGWDKTLLGRPPFSDVTGKVELDLSVFDSAIAQESLCWSSEGWELDMSSSADLDGWQYALTFHTPFSPHPCFWALVRRRKWVRACEPACEPSFSSLAADELKEPVDAGLLVTDSLWSQLGAWQGKGMFNQGPLLLLLVS